MKNENKLSNRAFFGKVQRGLWFFLSLLGVYILYETVDLIGNPSANPGMYMMIPEMAEHLLAGLIIVLAFSAVVDLFVDREV